MAQAAGTEGPRSSYLCFVGEVFGVGGWRRRSVWVMPSSPIIPTRSEGSDGRRPFLAGASCVLRVGAGVVVLAVRGRGGGVGCTVREKRLGGTEVLSARPEEERGRAKRRANTVSRRAPDANL